jgi:hypothetical protein
MGMSTLSLMAGNHMSVDQPTRASSKIAPGFGGGRSRSSRRALLVVAAVLGVALAAAPFAFNMFERAPKGATMLADFKPFMTTPRLNGFHADIGQINSAVHEVDTKATSRLARHSALGHPRAPSSTYRSFSRQWPTINTTMTSLLNKVQGNLGNYQAVAALPSFRLFPWFFVFPGVLIFGFALLGLLGFFSRGVTRIALVVLGIGLLLAPVAFQMFTRAPKGGHMMSAFKTIETTQNVEQIQGYFSTMAVGQGAMRLSVVPALRDTGLTRSQVGRQFPATTRLDRDWVHILNDMTPMIGAMSDNVTSYQAIAALPPFPLFPWFFVIPGVLVAGLAWFSRTGDDADPSGPAATEGVP